jgi:hypothetical protein
MIAEKLVMNEAASLKRSIDGFLQSGVYGITSFIARIKTSLSINARDSKLILKD